MPSYVDDPSIVDADDLWRRIPPWHIYFDENLGRKRPSSAAFEDDPEVDEEGKPEPMSSYVAREVYAAGAEHTDILADLKDFCLASYKAALARELGLGIAFQPAELPGHCVVFGKKTGSVKRKFSLGSEWVVAPPQHVPPAKE